MQERVDDDYSDYTIVSKETVEAFFQQAKEYVDYIQNLIRENSNEDQQ